ncbi:DUF5695 domain-containing protein [Rathayibacter festucae]|uniref:DUF5695 domain-containing protein n=1 Tax=Rathayibacter festucae TaxID=110937 RepID=UPI001FB39E3D|nr:DUF5695 domain-containing protein [Rathayibacter festucae]MCJ1701795.1 DUF5695 domain-containing protein [Rathayibacter festucae]
MTVPSPSSPVDPESSAPGLRRRSVLLGAAGVASSAALVASAAPSAAFALGPTADLSSPAFDFRVDRATGGVFVLSDPRDGYGTNYVANPDIRPIFSVDDSRWTGDAVFSVRKGAATGGTAMVTGRSDDIRTVSTSADSVTVAYSGRAADANGIRDFALTQRYQLTGAQRDRVSWTMTLRNTSTESLEFLDVGIPFLMNAWWDGGNQTGIYEKNVARHSFVGRDGSYITWQRPNGDGSTLVLVPQDGTSLEFKNKARPGEGPFAEQDPSWEGLVEFYLHSAASVPQRRNQAGTYLPTSSLTLAPGQEKTYGFTFRWAADATDLRDVLFDAGVVDVVSLPGMVVPTDTTATLAVRAKAGITSVVGQSGRGVSVIAKGTRNGYSLYEVSLPQLGASTVTVTYGGSKTSVLQYYAIEPIEKLIGMHANFIATKQQAKTTRGYNGAFLQWDMSNQKLVTWDDYPGGGWKEWMAGGADDLGLAPAVFLAEKNIDTPVAAEIAAVDTYIDTFILGYLQGRKDSSGQPTYQVYRWYDGRDGTPNDQGVWRTYNYIHIANTYYAMYRIAQIKPALTKRSATDYLRLTFKTLEAMFTKIPLPSPIGDGAIKHGMMGEHTYPDILNALRAEGMTADADSLEQFLLPKRDFFFAEKYPFGSEMSIDTTGFEVSYTLAKKYGNRALADKVQKASLTCRGMQPLWYFYGSDNRHMGESWWNLGYECQLGAWQQHDYLLTYGDPAGRDFADSVRSTNGAYLSGWANINSGQISPLAGNIGAASWIYQSEKGTNEYGFMPILDGWWAWSGEAALGFWGGLRSATATVIDDPIVGPYAYGADMTTTSTGLVLVPKDGVRRRITLFTLGKLDIRIERGTYTRAEIQQAGADIRLTLRNTSGAGFAPLIDLVNLPAGSYSVTVDGGAAVGTVRSDGRSPVRVAVPATSASAPVVRIVRDQNLATAATATASFTAAWNRVTGLNDGAEPTTSRDVVPDDNATTWGAWPQVSAQSVQYTWPSATSVRRLATYFVDNLDASGTGITTPASWSAEYWDGAAWKPVPSPSAFSTAANGWNTVTFAPVTTTRLRLLLTPRGTVSGKGSVGIKEWQVF